MLTKQQIFDKVVRRAAIKKQCMVHKSASQGMDTVCLYRLYHSPTDYECCFVGALIDEENYTYKSEGVIPCAKDYETEASKCLNQSLKNSGVDVEKVCRLLQQLQAVHDEQEPKNWPYHLGLIVANDDELNDKVLNEVFGDVG